MHADLLIANIFFAQCSCFSSFSFWPSSQMSADLCWGKGWELEDLLKDEGWKKQTKMVTAGKATTPEAGRTQGRKGLELPETGSWEGALGRWDSNLEDRELSWAMRQLVLRAPVKGLEPGRSLLWGGGALLGWHWWEEQAREEGSFSASHLPVSLLGCSGCHKASGKPYNRCLFPHSSGGWKDRSRCRPIWLLSRPLSLDYRWPPSPESSWGFPSRHLAGVGCHFLLQRIFLIQGLNPGLSLVSPALAGQILYHCAT